MQRLLAVEGHRWGMEAVVQVADRCTVCACTHNAEEGERRERDGGEDHVEDVGCVRGGDKQVLTPAETQRDGLQCINILVGIMNGFKSNVTHNVPGFAATNTLLGGCRLQ